MILVISLKPLSDNSWKVFYLCLFLFVYKNQTDVIRFRKDMLNIKKHYGKRCFVAEAKKGDKTEVLGMVAYEDTELWFKSSVAQLWKFLCTAKSVADRTINYGLNQKRPQQKMSI